MQRIITTPLASRFCAPRQRSAQSPPHARSPFRSVLLHSDARSPLCSALLHSDVRSPFRSALLPPDARSPFRSVLLHSDARSPFRSALLHSDARSPLRPAADRHTRAAAFRSAFPALCRRTACGVPHFGNVSICWQKNAGGCPRLFPNCLETFPFFDYSILPLFDFVNPFFSFFFDSLHAALLSPSVYALSVLRHDDHPLFFLHGHRRFSRRRRTRKLLPQKRRTRRQPSRLNGTQRIPFRKLFGQAAPRRLRRRTQVVPKF